MRERERERDGFIAWGVIQGWTRSSAAQLEPGTSGTCLRPEEQGSGMVGGRVREREGEFWPYKI